MPRHRLPQLLPLLAVATLGLFCACGLGERENPIVYSTVFDTAVWTGSEGSLSVTLAVDRGSVSGTITYGDTTVAVGGTESRSIYQQVPSLSFDLTTHPGGYSLTYYGEFTSSQYNQVRGSLTGRLTSNLSGRWTLTLVRS